MIAVVKPVFGRGPLPRYAQLADLLRGRIERGVWGPGTRLPSLEQLIEEFSLARVTVRQAIDMLHREGLVSPQQGRGTVVTARPARPRRSSWRGRAWSATAAIAPAHQSVTLAAADTEVAAHLDVSVNSPVALVRRVCVGPDTTVLYVGEVTYRGDFVRFEMDLKP